MTTKKRQQFTCQVYPDSAWQWRWRLKAPNGKIVADGSEGYRRRSSAVMAARRLVESTQRMRVVDDWGLLP